MAARPKVASNDLGSRSNLLGETRAKKLAQPMKHKSVSRHNDDEISTFAAVSASFAVLAALSGVTKVSSDMRSSL
ncbi:hypothetical protein GUITHDRAFT_155719 [Guillardia theta CCMP2712]|uniref:Uncharacterized protein n=1 Tax=Guillardia theta (strain CCMP2712) TaxID=905079 RepID=L1IDZ7_GUITC|nr:hypothetical protein GUITHDRAFT_155719 [Guillardia theta CCMP2712]EKX34496.1 hypothetical protein GUITHDRAFT_155719 [Guillardia theta CCMP2712]|eukprot:XP_005821476.1 hypothetical protein GUITHDRAFT_155719 [Guillardia theta CCMP2712]